MDERVNDFLNEINEISPLSEPKEENVWEKCFDDDSGYHYYWNTKTNKVTWDVPPDYKANQTKTKKPNLYIPPRSAPLFPSANTIMPPAPAPESIKIYKIGQTVESALSPSSSKSTTPKKVSKIENKKNIKRERRHSSDDEKIMLISSYGGDSESDEEPTSDEENVVTNGSNQSNSKNPVDISVQLKSNKKSIENKPLPIIEPKIAVNPLKPEVIPPISGFSLVAGYSDSEEESDIEPVPPVKSLFPENKISHSTLFPVPQPIDVKDFEPPSPEPPPDEQKEEEFCKAFQRKKRIGVAIVNTGKKRIEKVDENDEGGERKGFGFSCDAKENNSAESSYPGFKSGGVMFVKSDVPKSSSPELSTKVEMSVEIEDIYTTLKEKLAFLSEGREVVSPVQVMLIQIETLHTALKAGDLRHGYLRKWLEETCSDLIKLEKETTPEGWLLQWDRSHKRYYYQNEASGESQWEYPVADVTVCDEAMDICTTPPPNGVEAAIHMSPPPPPSVKSPSPPPPPKISDFNCMTRKKRKDDKVIDNAQPLPPGVDISDVPEPVKDNGKSDELKDALSSFYSDIAAIETSSSPPPDLLSEEKSEPVDNSGEPLKKKKKNKVKLAQGLSMKKKGVSKLVEKWKNVQMSYD